MAEASMTETAAVRADLALQGVSARLGLNRLYFDSREYLRARAERPALDRYREQGVLFIHVPKCGGVSIERQLGTFHGHRSAAYFRYADPRLFGRLHKMALVRNPFDRLVSGFRYLKGHTRSFRDRDWAAATLAGVDTVPDFLAALEDPRFRERVQHWLHFVPQWYYLCDRYGRLLVDEVGRLEAFDAFAASLGRRLGREIVPIRANASGSGRYREDFTPRAVAVVRAMYGRDFALFGYPPDPAAP